MFIPGGIRRVKVGYGGPVGHKVPNKDGQEANMTYGLYSLQGCEEKGRRRLLRQVSPGLRIRREEDHVDQDNGGLEGRQAKKEAEHGGAVLGPARHQAGPYSHGQGEGVGRAEDGPAQVVQGEEEAQPGGRQPTCAAGKQTWELSENK